MGPSQKIEPILSRTEFQPLKEVGFETIHLAKICIRPKTPGRIEETARNLVKHLPQVKHLITLGFSAKNLSQILSKSSFGLEAALKQLFKPETQATFVNLTKTGKFQCSQISSILNGSGSGLPRSLAELRRCNDQLLTLADAPELKPFHLGEVLAKTGPHLGKALDSLATHKHTLFNFANTPRFNSNDIAHFLIGSTRHTNLAIEALIKHKPALIDLANRADLNGIDIVDIISSQKHVVQPGLNALIRNKEPLIGLIANKGYPSKAISKMLHGSGKNVGKAISGIQENLPALNKLTETNGFSIMGIAEMVSGSGAKVGERLHALSESKDTLFALAEAESRSYRPSNPGGLIAKILKSPGASFESNLQTITQYSDQLKTLIFQASSSKAAYSEIKVCAGANLSEKLAFYTSNQPSRSQIATNTFDMPAAFSNLPRLNEAADSNDSITSADLSLGDFLGEINFLDEVAGDNDYWQITADLPEPSVVTPPASKKPRL